ncbi:hypothetical protein [Phenylobacterium sp.]|uniref:hypothetical protein n=1 Tax=Phenylobacterium sp. TaxID=1871053 RepID=UPI0035B3BD0B
MSVAHRPAWADYAEGFWFSPAASQAMEHARRAGMKLSEFSGVFFPIRATAYVTFHIEATGEVRTFDAEGERA